MTKIIGKWTGREYTVALYETPEKLGVSPFWTYTYQEEWNGKSLTMYPTISYTSEQHATEARAIEVCQERDWLSAANGGPLSREHYETECLRLGVAPLADVYCSLYGDPLGFGAPIATCVQHAIGYRRARMIESEKDAVRAAAKVARTAKQAAAASRPMKSTRTQRVPSGVGIGTSVPHGDDVWTAVSVVPAGIITEDDPSIYGSALLGHEGEQAFDVTWEIR